MSAKLPDATREKIRAYWLADTSLTYQDVATRFVCSVRQVRCAVEGLPREGPRAHLAEIGRMGAAVRDGKAPDGAMRVLKQIQIFRAHNGFSPTLRELCVILEMNSTHGMRCHFDVLQARGLITWEPAKARTVLVTAKGQQAIAEAVTP